MGLIKISADALVPAAAETVYAILADYHDKHPRILPRPPFGDLTVNQGGSGAGTEISFTMQVMGKTQTFHATISEPEPGRMLVETDVERGTVTTFVVEPRGATQAHVTITTEMPGPEGFAGRLQQWFTGRLLRPVYQKELANLAELAGQAAAAPS